MSLNLGHSTRTFRWEEVTLVRFRLVTRALTPMYLKLLLSVLNVEWYSQSNHNLESWNCLYQNVVLCIQNASKLSGTFVPSSSVKRGTTYCQFLHLVLEELWNPSLPRLTQVCKTPSYRVYEKYFINQLFLSRWREPLDWTNGLPNISGWSASFQLINIL